MKKIFYTLLISILLFSCEKYPDPGYETVDYFQYNIIGNEQFSQGGHYIPQEVGIQIDTASMFEKERIYRIELEVTLGNGSIDQHTIYADASGKMTTKWELGQDANQQELTGHIYNADNAYTSSFNITAFAYYYDSWNLYEEGKFIGIRDMICDTVNQRSMMYNQRQIWVSTDNFHDWIPKIFPFNSTVRMLDMTSDGTVFAACWNGALYKTDNWGETWEYVCDPIPEGKSFYNFNITSDDYLWATKTSFGVYCSKNKGLTWTKDNSEPAQKNYIGPIFKYGDSYLTMGGNLMSIIQTTDGGITWNALNTPQYSLSMYVPNDTTIITQNQSGFRLNKSTDEGQTYKEVFHPATTMGGGDQWHLFNKFGNEYYVLAPGGGVWKTRDFETFEELLLIDSHQKKLFIDHRGDIYVAGYAYLNAENEPTYIYPHSK